MVKADLIHPRFIVLFLVVAAVSAMPASAQTLAGTWETVATLDVTGKVSRILETYDRHRNWVSTGPSAFTGGAHGVWKRIDASHYSTSGVIFGYDPGTGNLAYTMKVRAELELDEGGNRHRGVFEVEIRDLDDNVLAVNTGTSISTRLTVDED